MLRILSFRATNMNHPRKDVFNSFEELVAHCNISFVVRIHPTEKRLLGKRHKLSLKMHKLLQPNGALGKHENVPLFLSMCTCLP